MIILRNDKLIAGHLSTSNTAASNGTYRAAMVTELGKALHVHDVPRKFMNKGEVIDNIQLLFIVVQVLILLVNWSWCWVNE